MAKPITPTSNPSLAPLNWLIGTWNVTMKHIAIPEPLDWQDSFEWLDNAYILWHWQGKNEVPRSLFLISRNENAQKDTYMLFAYDARGVSRISEMTFANGIWKFWRNDTDFYQKFEGKVNEAGDTITGEGLI